MRKLSIVLLSLSFFPIVSAWKGPTAKRPQDLIIGKWWSMAGSQKVTLEFTKGGKYNTTVGGQTTKGTYKWLDDSTLELNKTQKVKVTVSQDKLTMTIGNETSKFEREKTAASFPGEQTGASPGAVN